MNDLHAAIRDTGRTAQTEGPEKRTKSSVDYGPGMTSSRCGLCEHFEPPRTCALVEGRIDTYDWCKLFRRKQ